MVAPRLRALLVQSRGAGALAGEGVRTGRSEHPICGDEVELDVRVVAGKIEALRWRASGCPATQAVAAAAAEAIVGCTPSEAPQVLRAHLASLGDLAAHERHAEGMVLRALQQACGA
jgi:NifU-like protein involved in Fe-S cluster formation